MKQRLREIHGYPRLLATKLYFLPINVRNNRPTGRRSRSEDPQNAIFICSKSNNPTLHVPVVSEVMQGIERPVFWSRRFHISTCKKKKLMPDDGRLDVADPGQRLLWSTREWLYTQRSCTEHCCARAYHIYSICKVS